MTAEPEAAPETNENNRFFRLLNRVSDAGVIAGGCALIAITLIVTYDVIARFIGHPTIWATEISGYLLIAVAVLGAADTLRRNEHFAMTLLVDTLRGQVRRWVSLAAWCVVLLLVAGLVLGIAALIANSARFGLRSYTILQVPLILPQIVLLVGFAILALALAGRVIALVRQLRTHTTRQE
ncbi:TRAP transporter small permease [Vineibacter terrae]|uniref:TRAP transporter small permease protein n=1 Tax=Vineibacter terrae TaxID=2586908 RepID=A0A5C8PEW3_9HYPH|nr:TRAP transporter small permease [Vineibacter terrae]TXL72309.1 TRAP transporter small permease [Vineibacter terrae]